MIRRAPSFRTRLRAFREMRGDPADRGFIADLEFLENRDLDLSIRLGALLAFNALLIGVGTYPVSASPGAPLSLDAGVQPILTVLSLIGIAPVAVSSVVCLRAALRGEVFDADGLEDVEDLRHRLFAAFVHSIDVADGHLRQAITWTLTGGAATVGVWVAILAEKVRQGVGG